MNVYRLRILLNVPTYSPGSWEFRNGKSVTGGHSYSFFSKITPLQTYCRGTDQFASAIQATDLWENPSFEN